MIVSQAVYLWFVTAMVVGICLGLAAYDVMMLKRSRARRAAGGDASRDQAFGAAIGILIAAIGLAGVFKYHLGL